MMDCSDCLCPNAQAKAELSLEQALRENEKERKILITDLEKAGVCFPVTELETKATSRLQSNENSAGETQGEREDPPADTSGKEEGDHQLTNEDYATHMPDDLKDLLRRYYQLEAEREALKANGNLAGMSTAPNSENGDVENRASYSLERIRTPRAPLWMLRGNSVAIVEGAGDCELQGRSGKSKHVWVPWEDESQASSSKVTVVYPKERTRRIRCGLCFCVLIVLGLTALTVYYALNRKEGERTSTNISSATASTPAPVPSPSPTTPSPTEVPCVDDVVVSKQCFVRSEPIGVRFGNCDPSPDDWLAVYPADEDPSSLPEGYVEWMYTCGNKQCRGIVQSSFYTFRLFEPGTYKIHLLDSKRRSPVAAAASSVEFEVVRSRLDCPSEVDISAELATSP